MSNKRLDPPPITAMEITKMAIPTNAAGPMLTINKAIQIMTGMMKVMANGWNPIAKSILDKSVARIDVTFPFVNLCLVLLEALKDFFKRAVVRIDLHWAPTVMELCKKWLIIIPAKSNMAAVPMA
ncbi:hypothetical protein WICPIJ_009313 [Wickerhamomyces pijperi]|uniref:Uncharacterized protein n=1 Tax=Wickerhamomyces pijperi TaxID=599730 RepID=A0A9P8PQF8_WICPI|nr:hypothetical protein WICPIJ_009313 [Wickerhamomyces pijperi]